MVWPQNALFAAKLVNGAAFYPFDRFSCLLRTSPELVQAGYLNVPYTNIIDTAKRSVKNDGVLSLWNGYLVSLVRRQLATPVMTFCRGYARRWKIGPMKSHGFLKWLLNDMAVASLGAAASLLVIVTTFLLCNVND